MKSTKVQLWIPIANHKSKTAHIHSLLEMMNLTLLA
jgi:hypothetical protein